MDQEIDWREHINPNSLTDCMLVGGAPNAGFAETHSFGVFCVLNEHLNKFPGRRAHMAFHDTVVNAHCCRDRWDDIGLHIFNTGLNGEVDGKPVSIDGIGKYSLKGGSHGGSTTATHALTCLILGGFKNLWLFGLSGPGRDAQTDILFSYRDHCHDKYQDVKVAIWPERLTFVGYLK